MRLRTARRLAFAFFATYAIVQTFPGVLPFNRIRPLILGLPFSFFWPTVWVAAAVVIFWVLGRAEARARREG
ncbi:MAG TPA: DUF3311 domain-containing protein [Longimicrobiales bacterium]